jgi:endonuclease YncB( thermonuclease family)
MGQAMKCRVTPAVFAIVVLLGSSCRTAPVATAGADDATGSIVLAQVNRVIDGDSLDAHVDGKRTAVGFLGAEAPPLNQPCGRPAQARNRELVGGQVLLEADPAYQLDDVGRRLYSVCTPEGLWIEEVLIREGLARAVRTDAIYGAYLAEAQAHAEAARTGCLWAAS